VARPKAEPFARFARRRLAADIRDFGREPTPYAEVRRSGRVKVSEILQLSVKPINGTFGIEGTYPISLASPNNKSDPVRIFQSDQKALRNIFGSVCTLTYMSRYEIRQTRVSG